MIWNYKCPICGEWCYCDWDERETNVTCSKKTVYTIPTPAQQHNAYVDTHNWPAEMEGVVVTLKGNKCTAPDCDNYYQTLDHRIPYSKNGKTSIDNLFPMCNECNQSKSDKNYYEWLSEE